MESEKIDEIAQLIELTYNDDRYMVTYQNKVFYIKKFLYEVLEGIKYKKEEIAFEDIKAQYSLSDSDLDSLKTDIQNSILKITSSANSNKYINFSFSIFKGQSVVFISDFLKVLFNTRLFAFLGIFCIGINIALFLKFGFNNSKSFSALTLPEVFILYISLFGIMLFHEFGHSSAARYFKIVPQEIGFGFYFIFPVLFANVTHVWKLPKMQRIVVNLGGVYFQLIINAFLSIFLLLKNPGHVFVSLYQLNLVVALYSLLPFIRNDGYWVFADLYGIHNLNKRAYALPFEFIKSLFIKEKLSDVSLPLALYSIGNYLFIGYMTFHFVPMLPYTLNQTVTLIVKQGLLETLTHHIGLIIRTIMNLFIVFITLRFLIKGIIELFKKYFLAK